MKFTFYTSQLSAQQRNNVLSNNGLSRYLMNLDVGRKATPRSWLYEDRAPANILSDWLLQLQDLQSGSTFEKEVYHFDTSQLKKWGPQGEIAPMSELLPMIKETFSHGKGTMTQFRFFGSDAWLKAKQLAIKYLIEETGLTYRLRPRAYNSVIDDMSSRDTLSSNSGWPLFTRRKNPEVISASIADAENGNWKRYPAIALFRNYNQKTRLVWMFPMSANLVEASFVQPLQEALMKSDLSFVTPWRGFTSVKERISKLYGTGELLSACDFSSTDTYFNYVITREVLSVIKYAYQQKYWPRLSESIMRMHEIPLIIGANKICHGLHGVASGSYWTNFVETIFDFIWSEYLTVTHAVKEPAMAIGDDTLLRRETYSEGLPAVISLAARKAGLMINTEKVTNSVDKVKYLQRLFQRGYYSTETYSVKGVDYHYVRGVYSTIRALKSSVFPEKFHKPQDWNSDMFCLRQYAILENCVDHPLFDKFVVFIVKGQKDLIPFALKSSNELDSITRQSRSLPGLNPTYNQEKRDESLSNFASIRLVRQLVEKGELRV